jgi:transcriptional regulator with XRE-family HTH domain
MEKLQQFLTASGTRQSALADTLGINRGYMSELVSGRKIPSLPLATRIEQATAGAVPVGCWIPKETTAETAPNPDEDAA